MGENATLQVGAKFLLDVVWQLVLGCTRARQKGLEVLGQYLVERLGFRRSAGVGASSGMDVQGRHATPDCNMRSSSGEHRGKGSAVLRHVNVQTRGVLAPNARDRKHIVPDPPAGVEPSIQPDQVAAHGTRAQRLSWAALLARVFRLDVTLCPACGGRMKIVAALTDPHSIRTYLEGVGLPARPPPIAPARPDLQRELDYAA